ncbi:MAG: hypothetical protein JSR64_13540 [Nitrospira sp.]|nr:hypothetical protein [Nitrospira sp.]
MADRYEEKAREIRERYFLLISLGALTKREGDLREACAFAEKAIAAALREQDAWRPIETAPKDGTQILTWGRLHDDGGIDMGEQPRVRVSNWSPTYNCWYSACSGSHAPTFWRHIPAPPPDTGIAQLPSHETGGGKHG